MREERADPENDPVAATRPGRIVMPDKDFTTNLGQMQRAGQQQVYGEIGGAVDALWRFVLRPLRRAPVPAEPASLTWDELRREADRQRRADVAFAVLSGAAVALAILVLAGTLDPHEYVAVLARQTWWLAGAIWGLFAFLVRRWRF